MRAKGQRLPRDPPVWAHLGIAALVANALPYWLFAFGEQRVASNVAGAISATTPLWTAVFVVALGGGDRPLPAQLAGLLGGFVGVAVLLAPWSRASGASMLGAAACLAAAASYGVSYLYMARHLTRRGLPPLVLACGQLLAASAVLIAITPVAGLQPIHVAAMPLLGLGVLGTLGTGAAYILNYRIVTDDGPSVASTVTYLLPVVSIGLGVAFLDEPATWNLFFGTMIVLAGVAIVRRTPTGAA